MQTMAMGKPIMIGEDVIRKHVENLSQTAIDPGDDGCS